MALKFLVVYQGKKCILKFGYFLTGPTSFAPIIETAIGIVDSTGGQYHVLLIIADGQVSKCIIKFWPFLPPVLSGH
jgi:hypothetical protein